MFNRSLNNTFNNKYNLLFVSKHIRCLNANKCSKTIGVSETDSFRKSGQTVYKSDDIDHFGIFDTNSKEVSGLYDSNVCEAVDKYKELVESRQKKSNQQKYLTTSFGKVRLDSDNQPAFHGQFDPTNTRLKFNIKEFEKRLENSKTEDKTEDMSQTTIPVDGENNIFEEQYFDGLKDNQLKTADSLVDNSCSTEPEKSDLSFIDRQYFQRNPNFEPLIKSRINFKFNKDFNEFLKEKSSEFNSIENFYQKSVENRSKKWKSMETDDNNIDRDNLKLESPLKSNLFSESFDEFKPYSAENPSEDLNHLIEDKIAEQLDIKLQDFEQKTMDYKKINRTGAQYLEDLQSGKEEPKHPKIFTEEIRKFRSEFNLKGEKLDSKGFRILSSQVFDYTKMTKEDIIRLLEMSIIFDDNDILAINKPYGMSIHSKESNFSPVLTDYLPKLSEIVGSEKLYTVHRLDRDTTGILLMAKTQEKAKQLNKMFFEHSVVKRYLCITRGVPDEVEGIIDIPIDIGKCDNMERMVLRPEALEEYKGIIKPSKVAKRAVTQYKVVSQNKNAALIEVWPQTGVRHQIRVHLGFGLRCPILGDHKYSHLDRIAPQKLTSDILLALNVRQSKVRYIPLHLHAFQYCLSGAGSEGRNIFINATLPHHFQKNMSQLRLRQ